MNPIQADLHLHSVYSDGTLSPEQLVVEARDAGLRAVALTDHDTVDGLSEMRAAAAESGLAWLSGLELTCDLDGRNVHILAYLFDEEDRRLRELLSATRAERESRGHAMVEKLATLGMSVSFDEVKRQAGRAPVGRPHVARALVAAGVVPSVDDVFRRYLFDDGPAFVSARTVSCAEGIALVKAAGGVTVLAHPGLYWKTMSVERMIDTLAEQGLTGLEVWHPRHRPDDVKWLARVAEQRGLVPTGGSDYHGAPGGDVSPGSSGAGLDTIERLRSARS